MTKNNETISKIPEWVRWLLVPVTSILTVVFVWFVAALAAKIFVFLGGNQGLSENFFIYLIVPGLASYCSVNTAAYMAPKFNNATKITISSIWMFVAGIFTFFTFLSLEWTALIQIASFSFGSIAVLHENYNG